MYYWIHQSFYMAKVVPFIGGWLADRLLGDPEGWPHPVVGFGKVISGMYPVEYACSEKIAHYIKMRYDHEITDEETAYLAVHIRRIQPEKELEEDLH